jgi:protocatechuate 3,4-dioxygenase beta subunit
VLLAGAAGFGAATARLPLWAETGNACSLTPELTVGPYYVDYELMRRNIREGKPGIPLDLKIAILHARTCAPLAGAAVDLWHCDALGIYSSYTKMNPDAMGPPPGMEGPDGMPPPPPPGAGGMPAGPPPPGGPHGRPPQMKPTDKETFLRGVQLTDAHGAAEFATIYPGWYVSRDTHIHLKVHIGGTGSGNKYTGGHVCHTGQIAFSDEITDAVGKLEPYAQHKEARTRLDQDTVFHGDLSEVMLKLSPKNAADLTHGFIGTIAFYVDPDAQPGPEHFPGPGGPPPYS